MRRFSDATVKHTFDPASSAQAQRTELFDRLEPRQLMAGSSPFPDVSDLQNASNPVARIVTSFGDIDIEVFYATSRNAAATFIQYIEQGDYDQSFFHRLVQNATLHGGHFRFDDSDGLSPVPTHDPLHLEVDPEHEGEFSNVQRTLALVDTGSPDAFTGEFFFNLADNPGTDREGTRVFGRVMTDVSWSVVMTIANLPVVDMSGAPAFAGPFAGEFTSVPGGPTPTESNLVTILDIEMIKPVGYADAGVGFYTESVIYPEGFAGSTINEFLPISNPTPNQGPPADTFAYYQVIVRAERPQGAPLDGYTWFRDKVIASGGIGPNARGGITISHFGQDGAPSADDLVPQGVPYSIEVRSTKPLAVNLSHYDFGTSTGEAFGSEVSKTWTFADATKLNNSINQFLVFYNPDAVPVNVGVTFLLGDGSTRTTGVQIDRYRRGGININEIGSLPNNTSFSVKVSADREIVAALTGYDTRGDKSGFTELGLAGAGSTRGIIPMGAAGEDAQQFIAILNASDSTAAVITLVLSFSDGSPDLAVTPASLILQPGARNVFNLADIPEANNGRRYTVRYTSGSTPIYAHARNVQFGDEVRYPVSVDAATRWFYAEGFMDPGRAGDDVLETLSIYNPNNEALGRANADAHVSIRFLYTDGTVVTENRTIASAGRLDLDIHELTSVLNQGTQNARFYYSIDVSSDVPINSQFWHHDLTLGGLQPSGGFGELGRPFGTIVRLG